MSDLDNLEILKNNFFELISEPLNYNEFIEELKKYYWWPKKHWIVDVIPWTEFIDGQVKPINIHILSDSMGLMTVYFELAPRVVTTFSLIKEDDVWHIDWQNREVWLLATEKWKRKIEGNLEVRFVDTFEEGKVNSIFKELYIINKWIQEELGTNEEKLVIVFGYDSLEYSLSETGYKPSGGGGNSRGKLILMAEQFPNLHEKTFESIYYESILLHEMIHEYSCYDRLWKGSINNLSLKLSLISEGVALYYQFKFLLEKIKFIQFDNSDAIILKIKSGIIEALNNREQILEYMSNQIFTEMNRKNPEVYNLSYFLGASLYNYFLQKLGFEKTRRIYSEAGNMETEQAKLYLADYYNKEEYLASSTYYFNSMLEELNLS